jgi:hypothetical protein
MKHQYFLKRSMFEQQQQRRRRNFYNGVISAVVAALATRQCLHVGGWFDYTVVFISAASFLNAAQEI